MSFDKTVPCLVVEIIAKKSRTSCLVHFRPHFGGYEETRPFDDAVAICNGDTVYTQNAKYASNDFLLAQGKLFGHGSACCGASCTSFPRYCGAGDVS